MPGLILVLPLGDPKAAAHWQLHQLHSSHTESRQHPLALGSVIVCYIV